MASADGLPPPPAAPVRSPPAAVNGEVEGRTASVGGSPSIEFRMHTPADATRAVLLCHPHPLYGGSMHSPVPLAIARRLAEAGSPRVGWARFNFRGIGASEGAYDAGRGEVDDARAVLGELRRRCPRASVSVCGHSFGSWVAYRLAAGEDEIERVLLVAPTMHFSFDDVPRRPAGHVSVFAGDRDELGPLEKVRTIAAHIGADLRVFEGYDHHFLKSRRALADAALPVIAPEAISQ